MNKVCTKCGIENPLTEFNHRKETKDGYNRRCRACSNEDIQEYRRTHPDIIKKIAKKNRIKDKDKHIEASKKWRHKTGYCKSDKFKALSRKYAKTEKAKKYHREYGRRYFKTEKGKAILRENRRRRLEKDENFKIAETLRKRLKDGLRSQGANRTSRYKDLLGCSISEFKIYIESLFQEGMTWENHGTHGWHIDHILPVDSFDLTKEEEQKKCFHWSNMQPLWAEDNLRKSNKILKAA